MILANTGSSEKALAYVNSAGAVGGVVGGLVMSAWGGPKRRVHGVLMGWFSSGLLAWFFLDLVVVSPFGRLLHFLAYLLSPIINGSNQAIWQAKVPPDLQGHVFSIRTADCLVRQPAGHAHCGSSG